MEIVYSKREVYIHERPNFTEKDSNKIGGSIQIVKNKNGHFIRFASYYDSANLDDWTYIGTNSNLTFSKDENDPLHIDNKIFNSNRLQFNIDDLKSIRRTYPGFGIASLTFILSDGSTWPPLHFHKGGSKEFLNELRKFLIFKKDVNDSRLFLVQRPDGKAFQQSLYELNLFNSDEHRSDVVKKFLNEPINTTLLSFSKVTSIIRDVLNPPELVAEQASPNQNEDGIGNLLDSVTNDNIHSTNNDGFELITRVDLGPMPSVQRGHPVDKILVQYDKEGRIVDPNKLKELIFRGGLHPSLRAELWKFLLSYYDWNSTHKERIEERKTKVDDYYRMKLQWKSFSEEQKMRCSIMRERESLIEKDVMRTDRCHSYFQSENSPNLQTMKDILMTYNMHNFDLGYVQGMSDLLAPIMVIFDNEVDSFWTFVGFMNKLEPNFHIDQLHIKLQLTHLQTLLEFIDSNFAHYLEKNESSNMYFCFRWILILFKREFTFPDIMRLWEVLWTDLPCKNFHLLICIAILLLKKNEIVANKFGFNEILKFVNDMSLQIDLERTLETAEGLYIQLSAFKNLPAAIAEILGFPINDELKDKENDECDQIEFSALNISNCPASSNDSKNISKDEECIEVLN